LTLSPLEPIWGFYFSLYVLNCLCWLKCSTLLSCWPINGSVGDIVACRTIKKNTHLFRNLCFYLSNPPVYTSCITPGSGSLFTETNLLWITDTHGANKKNPRNFIKTETLENTKLKRLGRSLITASNIMNIYYLWVQYPRYTHYKHTFCNIL